MIKNGKFFVLPPKDGSDFKQLFRELATIGAGRPMGKERLPVAPWTPELLAQAISRLDPSGVGVELRTIQLWFQDNNKGISPANIRWLARIFGCGDASATAEWQKELMAAQALLTAKRRSDKRADVSRLPDFVDDQPDREVAPEDTALTNVDEVEHSKRGFSLASTSEALFSHGSSLNLPACMFAGFTALGFFSYITGIHNVTYVRSDGLEKQVGFLWTVNWTFVFMLFLPLFVAFVSELVKFWKTEWRPKFLSPPGDLACDESWSFKVRSFSSSYWSVFLICVLFAGLFQWIGVSLIPLIKGGGDYAPDWDTMARIRPDVISLPEEIAFTCLAYIYMGICFYLFFAGLILLFTIIDDVWKMTGDAAISRQKDVSAPTLHEIFIRIMPGIFRCTVLGMLIAIVMKIQSAYLSSGGANIVAWLLEDMSSVVHARQSDVALINFRKPTHFSSLLVAISSCLVFLYGFIRLGSQSRSGLPLWRMAATMALLTFTYLTIDMFAGFSVLLSVATLFAIYALFNPSFGRSYTIRIESNQSVS